MYYCLMCKYTLLFSLLKEFDRFDPVQVMRVVFKKISNDWWYKWWKDIQIGESRWCRSPALSFSSSSVRPSVGASDYYLVRRFNSSCSNYYIICSTFKWIGAHVDEGWGFWRVNRKHRKVGCLMQRLNRAFIKILFIWHHLFDFTLITNRWTKIIPRKAKFATFVVFFLSFIIICFNAEKFFIKISLEFFMIDGAAVWSGRQSWSQSFWLIINCIVCRIE